MIPRVLGEMTKPDSDGARPPEPEGGRGRHDAALELLNAVARVAADGLELRPLLQRVSRVLVDSFDWDHAGFARLDREAGVFVVEAIASRIPTDVAAGYSRGLGSGVVGEVALTGRPVVLDDVTRHTDYVSVAQGIRCEICLPIVHGGEVVAILDVEDRRVRDAAAELPLLEAVARQIGGAIANARLHQEVLRRAQQLELLAEVSRIAIEAEDLEPALQRIAERLRERFDLLMCNIYFVDPHRPRLELKAIATRVRVPERPLDNLPLSRGIVGRALHLGRAQLVLDVRSDPDYVPLFPEVSAELSIPIHFRDRVLGVFNFENDRTNVFSQETVSLLQTLCDQLAGVIHLAALNRRLQETTEELEQANRRLQEMNRALEEISIVDALTGLANRRQFDRLLDMEWRRAIRGETPLALLLIDIDFFKRYNDTHGHLRGDAVLAEVAGLLGAAFTRAGDLVSRYGGEEFAVLLPNTTAESAAELAEQARARVEGRGIPHPASDAAPVVTVSLGVASTAPDPWRLPSALVERADRALYLAKAGGRNCTRVAE
jgi:diguanylate cyclase (GGDEF)-like protein